MADPMRRTLVIMAKAPMVGRVKTRLAQSIGAVEAARFYRFMSSSVAARLGADRRWQTIMAVSPDAALDSAVWPPHIPRIGQGCGDLGVRMQRIFDDVPAGPLLIIGTDIPAITPTHIEQAYKVLGGNNVVFGPAGDGGYWLVGCKRVPHTPKLFGNVRWSTPDALADTIANAAHLKVGLADSLNDVDDYAGYLSWRAPATRQVPGRD